MAAFQPEAQHAATSAPCTKWANAYLTLSRPVAVIAAVLMLTTKLELSAGANPAFIANQMGHVNAPVVPLKVKSKVVNYLILR